MVKRNGVARGVGRERKQRGAFIGGVPSLKDGPGPLLFFSPSEPHGIPELQKPARALRITLRGKRLPVREPRARGSRVANGTVTVPAKSAIRDLQFRVAPNGVVKRNGVARGVGRERKQRWVFIGGVPSLKDGPGPLLFFSPF